MRISYTDDGGNHEPLTRDATSAVVTLSDSSFPFMLCDFGLILRSPGCARALGSVA